MATETTTRKTTATTENGVWISRVRLARGILSAAISARNQLPIIPSAAYHKTRKTKGEENGEVAAARSEPAKKTIDDA